VGRGMPEARYTRRVILGRGIMSFSKRLPTGPRSWKGSQWIEIKRRLIRTVQTVQPIRTIWG
jgi:hypothetical protein